MPILLNPYQSFGGGPATQAHSYWRIFITAVNGSTVAQAQKIEMYASSARVDLCTGGTALESGHLSTFTAAKSFDDDYGSGDCWGQTLGAGAWIGYQFASPVIINEILLRNQYAFSTQQPQDFTIDYSDDGSNWFTKWAVTGEVSWLINEGRYFAYPGYTPPGHTGSRYGSHSYWRFLCLDNEAVNDKFTCSELEFRATPSGADQAAGGTALSFADLGGFPKANAWDNNTATLWASAGNDWGYIGYNFASPVIVAEAAWRARSDGFGPQSIRRGSVQFSDDGSKWHSAWEIYSPSTWSTAETRAFTDPNWV